jgi:LCP family protein required for cell wall assembly
MLESEEKPLPGRGMAALIRKKPHSVLTISVIVCLFLLMVMIVSTLIAYGNVTSELKARGEKIDVLKLHLSELTDDYNTLRGSLGLAPMDFALSEDRNENADSALVQGLQLIQSRYYDELKARHFQEFITGAPFRKAAADSGYRVEEAGLFSVALVTQRNIYYSLRYDPDQETVTIRAAGIADKYAGPWNEQTLSFLNQTRPQIDEYYSDVPAFKLALRELETDEKVKALLTEKELSFRMGGEDRSRIWAVVSKKKEDLLTIAFDKLEGLFLLNARKVDTRADLRAEMIQVLGSLDTRTVKEKRLDAVLISLKTELENPDFISSCREAGMKVAITPREAEEVVYFDITHQGMKIGALAVIRETADIYFVDKDDVQIQALRSLAGGSAFKKKSFRDINTVDSHNLFRSEEITTFLILGQNEDNADTTILVQADSRTSSLVMLSLPRDLFYRGARINKLPQAGFDHCLKRISELTGVEVTRYASVDIYSLISLIDLLGGIDVDLPRDLVDPTYRIKENGVWQTLAYQRGRHHFSGVQAMRIIRSRITTSDFDRALRQQLVLGALLEKLKTTCGQSMEAAIAVFSQLSRYATTNLSPLEIARYFFTFKDYTIRGRHVLDTSNILRHTYSMLYKLPEEEQELHMQTDDIEDLGAWILLPRNNDWDLLRSYIRSILTTS